MSKKSKMMKKINAKAAKSMGDPNKKSGLGIKKEGRHEVKKTDLIKALAEKSVTVVSPLSNPGSDTSGKKKRKRHKNKNRGFSDSQPNKEHQAVKDTSHPNSMSKPMERPKPVTPQQKVIPPVANAVSSGKSKKRRNRKKKNRSNSAVEKSVALKQGVGSIFVEQEKKVATEQLKTNQSKGFASKGQTVSPEVGSKKRKKRSRKRKAKIFSESSESLSEQKSSKRPKLSSEMASENIHQAEEEEASSNSEAELIHSDWHLNSENKSQSDVDQSSEDKEDLDTSEDDLDEEPVDMGEDSNDESSEDKSFDEKGDDEEETPNKKAKKESKKAEKKSTSVQSATIHAPKKKFSLSNKAEILKEIKERTADFNSRCLYISPIPPDSTFDTIKKFIPNVKSCQFFKRSKSDKLRAYVFVEFADAEAASKERLSIQGRLFAGQSVRVESRAAQKTYDASTVDNVDFSRIIVTGLVPTVNQTDLKAIFSTAESVQLPMTKNFNLGHATVTFVSDAVALDAFSLCHRYPLKGHPICVNFALRSGCNNKSSAPVASDTSKSSPKTTKSPAAEKFDQPQPERVGKVLIQQMKEDSKESDKSLKSTKKVNAELEKGQFGLTELINSSKKKTKSDDGSQESDEDVDESQNNSDDEDDDDEDESAEGQSDEETSEVGDSDGDADDADDDDDTSEEDPSNDADEDDGESNVEASDHGSEGEEIDAELEEVLKARKASTKALKSPGAKRNWKAPANIKAGEKRPAGSVPKVLPVPPSKRKKQM